VEMAEITPRPTPLEESGVVGWLRLFTDFWISEIPAEQVDTFLEEVEREVRPSLYSKESGWSADYVRLRFKAVLV